MAGYMIKLNGYSYEGEYVAAADLLNGALVNIASNKATAIATAKDMKFRVVALEGPYGMSGLKLVVEEQGDDEVFLVENLPEGEAAYDETTYGPASGEYVRMHRLLAGEEFYVSSAIIDPTGYSVGEWLYAGEDEQQTASMTVAKTITKVVDTSETTDVTGESLATFVLAEGDVIHYSVTVTNTGDLALAAISVTDPMKGETPGDVATLAKDATSSAIVYTHAVTGAEAGTVVSNTATAVCAHPRRPGVNITATKTATIGALAGE